MLVQFLQMRKKKTSYTKVISTVNTQSIYVVPVSPRTDNLWDFGGVAGLALLTWLGEMVPLCGHTLLLAPGAGFGLLGVRQNTSTSLGDARLFSHICSRFCKRNARNNSSYFRADEARALC